LSHAGQIVTHQHLKQELWGDVHVTEDSVPKCMSSLREHLQPDDCIQTVYKRGYRLSAEVHKIESASAQGLPRLAIVPFTTGFNVAAHLGAAVAEETIARLTAEPLAPALVLARDSVFTLAARGLSAQQVGEALKADLVLTGTIRALPTHFRLRAEMIRVADDTQIWIEDVLVPLGRISGLETELAQRLLVRLNGGGLAISASSAKEAADESDPIRREAYELFLRGHDEWQTPQRHRMQDGTRHLRRAIELNPSLVSAHIDLAHACITQGFYGFLSPALAAEQVRLAVAAIPPSIEGAEAILPAIGWIKFHVDHDLTGAIRAFETCSHLSQYRPQPSIRIHSRPGSMRDWLGPTTCLETQSGAWSRSSEHLSFSPTMKAPVSTEPSSWLLTATRTGQQLSRRILRESRPTSIWPLPYMAMRWLVPASGKRLE
jgi:TolB-like protein